MLPETGGPPKPQTLIFNYGSINDGIKVKSTKHRSKFLMLCFLSVVYPHGDLCSFIDIVSCVYLCGVSQ